MARRWSTVEQGRRQASRLALYLTLILLGAGLAAVPTLLDHWHDSRVEAPWLGVDWESVPEVRLLRDYVRIDTSWDSGSEIAGARFLAAELARVGIPSHLEVMGDRQANLWAILEGRQREALVLHNHIDTDPLGNDPSWKYPPLAGAIDPPWIYGRGVFDMKSVSIAQLLTMVRLKQSGVVPERSLIFLATGSEEVGSDLGTRFILAAHPELAKRFWAALTEGGVVEATTATDIKYWGIETAQRHMVEVFACASEPERLADLERDVNAFAAGAFGPTGDPPRLTPEVREIFGRYAQTRSIGEMRGLIEPADRPITDPLAFDALPAYLKSHLRAEISAFGGSAEAVRMVPLFLPGDHVASVLPHILPAWLTHGTTWFVRGSTLAPSGSRTDHPLFTAMAATVREHYPTAAVGPYFLPYSATDARFFRAAGIPAYGFSPFLILSTDTLQVGQANERMALQAFVAGVDLYAEVVQRAVGLPATKPPSGHASARPQP